MTTRYADRMFLTINTLPLVNLQSASVRRNKNARVVPSMTPDGFNRGFVQGNNDFDITAQVAVENLVSTPDLGSIDYQANNVEIHVLCGADLYVYTGVFMKDDEQNAGGVGDEVKKTWNFGAIKRTSSPLAAATADITTFIRGVGPG